VSTPSVAAPGPPALGATPGPPTAGSGTAPSATETVTPPGTGRSAGAAAETPGGATGVAPGDARAESQPRRGPSVAQSETRAGARGPNRVAITAPQSGHTLSADDPPIVIVRGRVEDPSVSSVSITANSRRHQARVRDGAFEYPVVVVDRTTTITAEVPSSAVRPSETVTVHASPEAIATGVIMFDWGEKKPAGEIGLSGTWRARADRLDGQQGKLLVRAATLPDDVPMTAFYVRNFNAGVYTLVLTYRGLDVTRALPKLYVATPGTPTVRELKPLSIGGSGKVIVIRVLLPQTILWEQDEWFSGRSEASDTITKFRDDGTAWIERKGEPR
jgi:hypothetical protein